MIRDFDKENKNKYIPEYIFCIWTLRSYFYVVINVLANIIHNTYSY